VTPAETTARRLAAALYPGKALRLVPMHRPVPARRGQRRPTPPDEWVVVAGGGFVESGVEIARGPTTAAAWEAAVPEARSRTVARLDAIVVECGALADESARLAAALEGDR
jgi:hypothetical protein